MSVHSALTQAASTRWYLLQIDVPEYIEQIVDDLVAFLPKLLGAIAVLVVGWILGVIAGRIVRELADRFEVDRMVAATPLGRFLGGTESAVADTFGTLTRWFVYAVAILAAANVLAVETLSEWIQTAISYLPAFVAGLLVIVFGFVVADFIGDAIMRTRAATQTRYTSWFAIGTRMFLYFTAIVIGLDTMGIDVDILYVFANAIAWGFAAAVAIGCGIAIGWGGHTYVEENIDRWMGQASRATPPPEGARERTRDEDDTTMD